MEIHRAAVAPRINRLRVGDGAVGQISGAAFEQHPVGVAAGAGCIGVGILLERIRACISHRPRIVATGT